MGGQIFVGIRTASGTEHVGLTWTNWLGGFFLQQELYEGEGGVPLAQLLEYWDVRKENDFDERCSRIRNSEYGVVLLDIPSKEIWEQNAAFTPSHYLLSPASTDHDRMLQACNYLEQGKYDKLVLWPFEGEGEERAPRPPTAEEIKILIRMNRTYANAKGERNVIYESTLKGPRYPGMLIIETGFAKLVHHSNEYLRKQFDWDEMRAWLKKRKWTTPVNATPRVR